MKKLIIIENNKAFTTSRIIAENSGVNHSAVRELIKKYKDDLNEIGLSSFQIRKGLKTGGRPTDEYLLDEIQATYILTLMKNSKKVVKFKKDLTRQFFKQQETIRKLILMQSNTQWTNVRKDGKQIYFQKTDVIKDFVEYATAQGSKSSKMYYMNFAKMENSTLFFIEQKYPNLRELLSITQLMHIATADTIIEKAIKRGMEEELNYKDIYKMAKNDIISFSEIIGKSPLISLTS